MAFFVIEAAPGLSRSGRRRAARAGPGAILTRSTYPSLMASAGFVDVDADDRTAEYRATQAAWIEAFEHHSEGLRDVFGERDFADRRRDRLTSLAAIDDGVLRRFLYIARAPTRRRTPRPPAGA